MKSLEHIAILALATVLVLGFESIFSQPSQARSYNKVGVWVYIYKHPSEDIWEACRRVYGRDVYQVRGAGPQEARCFVDASEVGDPRGFSSSHRNY